MVKPYPHYRKERGLLPLLNEENSSDNSIKTSGKGYDILVR